MLMHDPKQLNVVAEPSLEDPHETSGVHHGFQLPGWIWAAMIGAYGLFFAAITAATGRSGIALFSIVISIGYVVIFFGLASMLNGVKGAERPSPLKDGGLLQTWCGPMDTRTVAGQILVVPFCIALFAVGILIVRLAVIG
jgi:hypothetical protein